MAYRLPPLNSLRAFEAAARLGSFQKAAEDLFVTPSALSYQIRQLEEHLDVVLFHRQNRKVILSEDGERLYPGVHDGFERFQGAVGTLARARQNNVLVVSSGPAFAAKWLAPRMYRFVDSYPHLEMRIAASLKLVDFNTDEVDVGLRFGGGVYPDLHVEQLFEEEVLPLASPDYVERHKDEIEAQDYGSLTLMHDDSSRFLAGALNWGSWLRAMGDETTDATRGPRFNHADHGLDAAIDGAGIVFGRLTLAMRDIRSGRLVAPFDSYMKTKSGFYFVAPKPSVELERVQIFREWLLAQAAEEAVEIEAFLATMRSL
ncbi:MAG: transcriptional regulator GcvA [Pseudomonadota bacterium]